MTAADAARELNYLIGAVAVLVGVFGLVWCWVEWRSMGRRP